MDKQLNSAEPVVSRETAGPPAAASRQAERQSQAMLKRWAIKKAREASHWEAFKRRADARAAQLRARPGRTQTGRTGAG